MFMLYWFSQILRRMGGGVQLEKRRGEPESGKSRFYGVVMKVIPAHIVSYAIY
jgi:hypothetical protein